MPLTIEYRLFFKNHQLVACIPYWEEGIYTVEAPNLTPFQEIAQQVKSQFFSMDIAKTKTGDWIIIELGDGQVAGLSDNIDKTLFYSKLGFVKK